MTTLNAVVLMVSIAFASVMPNVGMPSVVMQSVVRPSVAAPSLLPSGDLYYKTFDGKNQ
jgi:hypothetical protein